MDTKSTIESYLDKSDWRVNENSNAAPTIGALLKHVAGQAFSEYWRKEVYDKINPEITKAHDSGHMHIHDISAGLTLYCCGYSLEKILKEGLHGIPNVSRSSPPKHLDSAFAQVVNLTTTFQNEIAGAVAYSSVDTRLAPYIKNDGLTEDQVLQEVQRFVYALNSNSRCGAEPAFTNITLDLTVPEDMKSKYPEIAGRKMLFTYGDCQREINMFNRALLRVYLEGDYNHRPFSYPIPTYNITKDFDWDSPIADLLFEVTGKYGVPYFANFINSDMDPSEIRSMCCRLRISLRELTRRNGGLFGSGDSTGSVGVVTLNLPRIAYETAHDPSRTDSLKDDFYRRLHYYMDLARESLQIKRKYLEDNILSRHLLPAFETYVGTLDNHFSTIGLIGMNEMCENLIGVGILNPLGKEFSLEVLEDMRSRLSDYQEEDKTVLWNLEATPAESTSFRLADLDVKEYPDTAHQGPKEAPYYTNSCHIPVKETPSVKELFDHQDDLQCKFTGGTVVHLYCGGPMSSAQAKHLIRTICTNYSLPYISISPIVTLCPEHGQLPQKADYCPHCGKKTTQLQRITGYIRDTQYWNPGKKSEYSDRVQFQNFNI